MTTTYYLVRRYEGSRSIDSKPIERRDVAERTAQAAANRHKRSADVLLVKAESRVVATKEPQTLSRVAS